MKRLIFLLSAIALLAGCAKIDEIDQPSGDQTEVETTGSELPEVIYANVADEEDAEDPQTRAYVGNDGKTVLWHNGDAISFFEGTSQNVKYVNSSEAGATATFKLVEGTGSEAESSFPYAHAIYPYSTEYTSSTVSGLATIQKVSVNYPATQTYAEGSFGRGANLMFGRVESEENPTNYTFRHVNGFLVLKLYGEGVKVKEISLTALGDVKIAGAAEINSFASASAISATMQETATSTVTLDCSNGGEGVALGATAETATEFWFALPEVTMAGGMKILVTSTDGILFEKQTANRVAIKRAKVQPMAALKFEANSPYQLLYTTSDGNRIDFSHLAEEDWGPFNVSMVEHTYENGQGIITFNNPLTHINEKAFYEKSTLTSVTFPNTLIHIGTSAFAETSLTEVTFPESLVEIGERAFKETLLTSLTIPGSVMNIYSRAFEFCYSIKTIEFKPSPTASALSFHYSTTDPRPAPFDSSPFETVILNRELVTKRNGENFDPVIGAQGLFWSSARVGYQYGFLTSVTIGEQVKTIGNFMFCGALFTSLEIPSNVNKIGDGAFMYCINLSNLTFAEGTEQIQIGYQFLDGSQYGPFYDSPLSTINLNRDLVPTAEFANIQNEWDEGIFANKFYDEVEEVSVTLGDKVETISKYMFNYLPITSITIPASVTQIGVDAFYKCTALSSINFQGSPTAATLAIGQGFNSLNYDLAPFYHSPLASVDIDRNLSYVDEDGVAFIPDADDEYLFTTSSNALTTVTIGGNATNIFNNMFNKCPNITSVTFEAGTSTLNLGYNTDYEGEDDRGNDVVGKGLFLDSPNINTVVLNRNINYSFGETITESDYSSLIRASIFNNNHALTNITIGNEVTSLPDYAFAGAGLSGKDIRLHEGLQTIGKYAFYDALINGGIYIPASVTMIKDGAFRLNNNSKITCLGTTPATIEGIPFYGHYNYIISVPAESVNAYKAAWTTYSNQIQAIE